MNGLRIPKCRMAPVAAIAKGTTVAALTLSLVTIGGGLEASAAADRGGGKASSALQFHDQMRKLWVDHIVYTRLTIVSFAASLPDLQVTEGRLLRNQSDIGNAFRPYFGNEAADELTELLRVHILTAVDILEAAKAGDTDKLNAAVAAWYANADEIADFLHRLNPRQWPRDELRHMMKEHLDLTLEEATDRLEGRFAEDIADFDQIHTQILGMADTLSCGIIGRFPNRFSSPKQVTCATHVRR